MPPGKPGWEPLLREAAAAARAGDRSEAERLYRRVLEEAPDQVAAWLGLGTVLEEPGRKAECFRRVLELDPENADAQASLKRLQAVLPAGEDEVLYCAFHPRVETVLRCSQCGRPICVRCATSYQVGQLCPLCLRGRRPAYYQPAASQLALAGGATFLTAVALGALASWIVAWSLILAFLGGTAAGALLYRVALWAGRRGRGLTMQLVAGGSALAGSFVGAGLSLLLSGQPFDPVWLSISFWLYAGLAVASLAAWLR